MASTLRIALWNANGLSQHRQEVEVFLNIHKIDIMFVTETHFTDKSYFRISKYKTYHANHPDGTAHGGTAIIVKENINHTEQEKTNEEYLQATNIKIQELTGATTLSAVYCPPKHQVSKNKFEDYFEMLGNRFIAGGDYNSKHPQWGSRVTNPKGKEMLKALTAKGYKHLSTGKPTYWPSDPNKLPDLLDFFVTKGLSHNYTSVESSYDLQSDHSPVILTISTTIIKREKNPTLYTKRTDWESFRKYLNDNINLKIPLKTSDDIDEAVENTIHHIQQAAWHSTPPITDDTPKEFDNNYPKFLRDKISEKRKARRLWQQTRHPNHKNKLNHLSKEVKNLIREIKNESFQHYLSNLSALPENNYSLWKATKKLKQPTQSIPPIRKPDGTWARENIEKAELFAVHFSKIFEPQPATLDEDEEDFENFLTSPLQLSPPIKHFTPTEIEQEIKYLNNKKSPGYDLINAKIMKELSKKTLVLITNIFNAIIRTCYFPLQWKFAQIILIHKPGKPPHEITSYRPISLLPLLSKLFEKLLLKRLNLIAEEENLIPTHQFGFRKQHSTIQQVHRIVNEIESSLQNKQICSGVFIDISQAFDKVWHKGLLYKIKTKLPHSYFLLIKSYLSERYFQIRHENTFSKIQPIKAGVPQGSVLGPVLYQLYTADLPCGDKVLTATYADDTAILATHEDPNTSSALLQKSLDDIQLWAEKWRIKINEHKSTHVVFTNRRVECPPIAINGNVIQTNDDVKYLGMHLDKGLIWRNHLKTKKKQIDIKIKKMYWLLGRNSQLSLENKLLLYKTTIIPIWTYGIQLWGCAKTSNINLIQRSQNKALRMIAQAPWYVNNYTLHKDFKIKYVYEQIRKFASTHEHKSTNHPNDMVANLTKNETSLRRLKRTEPSDLKHIQSN